MSISAARITANQENALQSTGPRTSEGKQRASLNATRHGLTSQVVVLPHEDMQAYLALHQETLKHRDPSRDPKEAISDLLGRCFYPTPGTTRAGWLLEFFLRQTSCENGSRPWRVQIRVKNKIYWLLLLVPITLAVRYTSPGSQTLIFALSAASMIPLARLLSDATENLAERLGPTLGGLLNVTFGNAGELVIGFFALRQGLHRVVKASISGSILVNLLLTLGISMLLAGVRKKTLTFNPLSARTQATMLLLAAVSLIFPAAYHFLAGPAAARREADLSLEFAVILLLTYGSCLLFTLHTHRQLLAVQTPAEHTGDAIWTSSRAFTILALSAVAIGWMGEVLVGSIEAASRTLGMTDLFVGIVILAIAGNAAESTSAVRAALRGRMDLSVGIGAGSSIQIALFVAPCLVLLSRFVGPGPMDLVFTPVEVLALVLAIAVTTQVAGDGESNWLEGVQLLAVYIMLAIIFFYLPETAKP